LVKPEFNPEIFTASLSQVMDCYRGRATPIHPLYTDAEQFFREATYPTEGLCMTLAEVFGRLAGDNSVPAIHRLETAFGGGKTHPLIALTHLGFRGHALATAIESMLDAQLLPAPGDITVVGVAGDEIPVRKPRGRALIPYTLWGEIAYQVGGEALYRQVEADATSYAAPGRNYFEQLLGNRKVLIMLDELAQYAARLETAIPNGGNQLAAFLMGLHGYARTHAGIAVVRTLASQADAFARQTQRLTELITEVQGEEITEETALGIAQRADTGVRSVVARDAVTVFRSRPPRSSGCLPSVCLSISISAPRVRQRTRIWTCTAGALRRCQIALPVRTSTRLWWLTTRFTLPSSSSSTKSWLPWKPSMAPVASYVYWPSPSAVCGRKSRVSR